MESGGLRMPEPYDGCTTRHFWAIAYPRICSLVVQHPWLMQNLVPDPEITLDVFRRWRDARRGTWHAEDLSNPYWSWLIRSGESSWAANEHFGGPSSYGGTPMWSAQRFGQSTTQLPDGRTLLVAGEHEDHYDPDFFIYNDVIVRHPDGRIEVLGFPEDIFPPTDFHSATWMDGQLVLIGNLGYTQQREVGKTQILIIDTYTWKIRNQPSAGEGPGWIHRHEAAMEDGFIIVRGGMVWTATNGGLVENFDDWRLCLNTWNWERLTRRRVTVLEFLHEDGTPNHLFQMGMWIFNHDFLMPGYDNVDPLPGLPDLKPELDAYDKNAPQDRDAFERRFSPDHVDHRELSAPEDSLERHIEVDGVRVRYLEETWLVRLTIEGELPAETVKSLSDDLIDKLERAEGVKYRVRTLSLR